jgi:hypothetical protein
VREFPLWSLRRIALLLHFRPLSLETPRSHGAAILRD